MSAKDRIEQQEREQSLSEMSALVEQLRNERQEDRRVLAQLIESQNSLTSMVEELSTLMNSGASSNAHDATLRLGGVKKRLASLEEAVTALGESLASSETVQLADGSSLKKSDVEAHALMEKTVAMIGDLRSNLLRRWRRRRRCASTTRSSPLGLQRTWRPASAHRSPTARGALKRP